MTTAILSTYGTFTPYHHTLKKLGHSPSECCVFGKIASLITTCGQAFVSLRAFAEELGYTRETISRAISKLEKAGRIKRTAQKKYGLFPYVEILPNPHQPVSESSTPVDHPSNAPCPSDHPQENKEKELKNQTQNVCLKENSREEKDLRQQITATGIATTQAQSLLKTHPAEQIRDKLAQLRHQLENHAAIKNPAGWLTSALKRDFKPCKAQSELQQKISDDTRRDNTRLAEALLRDAKLHEARNNLELARACAKDSLAKKPQDETQRYLTALETKIEKKEQLRQARKTLTPEEQHQFFEQAMADLRAKHGNKFDDTWLAHVARAQAENKMMS